VIEPPSTTQPTPPQPFRNSRRRDTITHPFLPLNRLPRDLTVSAFLRYEIKQGNKPVVEIEDDFSANKRCGGRGSDRASSELLCKLNDLLELGK
jgi:hypothetical protein